MSLGSAGRALPAASRPATVQGRIFRSVTFAILVSACVAVLIAASKGSGEAVQLREQDCLPCQIELSLIARLGTADDSTDITSSTTGERFGNGFIAAPVGDRAQFAIYDSTGLRRYVVGRLGAGPGEFTNIRSVAVLPRGQIAVLDARLTALSGLPPALLVSKALPPGVIARNLLALEDGRVLVNNYGPDRPAFCIFGSNLELVRCFGRQATSRQTAGDELQYSFSAARGGRFWAAPHMYRYSLEQWDTAGRQRLQVQLHASWFRPMNPVDDPHESPARVRPLPRINGVWEDDQARVWVVILVPDAAWHATTALTGRRGEGPGNGPMSVGEWAKYFDTKIEVFDLAHSAAVASARFPGVMSGLSSDGLLTELHERSDGTLQALILKPSLVRPTTRR